MHLTKLGLTNFRNYAHLELDLAPGLTLLLGNNAQGKTNLLEAIFYLATARSPHASAERELIRWGASSEPIPFARVQAEAARRRDDQVHLEIVLVQAPDENQHPSSRVSKRIKVNGVNKRALDLLGQLNVVLFLPEDLDLVFGAPSERRRYLDTTLSQIDSKYGRALSQYNQVLEQRNALLRDFRERSFNPFELETWDRKLVEPGAYIVARRARAVNDYNRLVADIHARLTGRGFPFAPDPEGRTMEKGEGEKLQIVYQPTFSLQGPARVRQMGLDLQPEFAALNETREQFTQQLEQMRPRELGAAMTLIGPHRDDLRFLVDGVDMITFASRGQGRTIALSLKMAEMELMRAETGEEPILLLDDVMSELDKPRRLALSHLVKNASQAIISATDLDDFAEELLARARVMRVIEGQVEEDGRSELESAADPIGALDEEMAPDEE